MTLEQLRPVADALHATRREAGLALEGFDISFALAEPMTAQVAGELARIGAHNAMVIAPWIGTPWDIQSWVDPQDDIRSIDVKKQALERYSSAVIAKAS
jgi:hypothetical protein